MTRVALAFRRDLWVQVARPYYLTLYELAALEEVERVERIAASHERLGLASWTGVALAEPKALESLKQDIESSHTLVREGPRAEAEREAIHQRIARARRVARRHRKRSA